MRKIKTIKIDGRELTVKELTVSQVDAILSGKTSLSCMAEMLLDTVIPVEAVVASAGITVDDINGMTGSELQTLWDEVEDVNGFLSRLLRRLVAAADGTTKTQASAPPSAF